ncbi:MAG: Hsp20/alpha crystallin family protein [Chitinophagaceae bacterium]|nr:Hsp20/alpha crystallin family protein [Chitinophagaceae bacterium]
MISSIVKRNSNGSNQPARTLTHWVDQLIGDSINRFFNDDFWGLKSWDATVNVPVNIKETDKSYEMSFMAPGLRKEDFKLNVSNNILTVSYEHKEEENQEDKNAGWLRKEFRMQSFSRSFTLDDTVDVEKITASYDNGVLHLSLPKKESAQTVSRTIEIK